MIYYITTRNHCPLRTHLNNFILGNGWLSERYNGGFLAIYGYFYPADLGIYGVIFVYGFILLLALLVQYLFWINFFFRFQNKKRYQSNFTLLYSLHSFIGCILLLSFLGGQVAFSPSLTLVLFSILTFGLNQKNKIEYG